MLKHFGPRVQCLPDSELIMRICAPRSVIANL